MPIKLLISLNKLFICFLELLFYCGDLVQSWLIKSFADILSEFGPRIDLDGHEFNDGQQEDARTAQAQAALYALLQGWQHIAEQMQTDLETFHKQRGDEAGGMMQNLRAVN